jgi:hypothetical protein
MAADEERHVFVFVNDKRDKTKQKTKQKTNKRQRMVS